MRICPAFIATLIKHVNKAVRMNYMALMPLPCTDPQSSSHNEDLYITLILLCNFSYGKSCLLWQRIYGRFLSIWTEFYIKLKTSSWYTVYKNGISFWHVSAYKFLWCKLGILFILKYLHAWSMDLMLFNPSAMRGWKIWDECPTGKFDN